MIQFDEEKLKNNIFNRIKEANIFSRHFGSFSKTDFEVLFFTIYLDSVQGPVRDYNISIDLGITESKARNLRVKSQLMYPKEIKWENELAKELNHAHYDATTKQITLTIEDPSVQSKIKNVIETEFGTVGHSLNYKQLVLPIESFLILATHAEKNQNEVFKKLCNQYKNFTKSERKIEKSTLLSNFLDDIDKPVEFIVSLLSIYDISKPLIQSLLNLIK